MIHMQYFLFVCLTRHSNGVLNMAAHADAAVAPSNVLHFLFLFCYFFASVAAQGTF